MVWYGMPPDPRYMIALQSLAMCPPKTTHGPPCSSTLAPALYRLQIVNRNDVLIVVGFRVWSDPCSNLNFGLIW